MESETPLLDHAVELRQRLITAMIALLCGFILSYAFAEEIYAFLVQPLADATAGEPRRLIYTGLAEAFISYIRLALWSGAIIAFPIIAWQLWAFVAPGLYETEKKAFLPFLIASPLLFFAGAAMAYGYVFPVAWDFFLSFETQSTLPIELEARVSEYLSLSMTFIFAFGLAFQLPVALILMARLGLVSAEKLASFRRFAIVLIFAAAAIMTPPDLFSQIALAVPMLILYEISVLGARFVQKQDGR